MTTWANVNAVRYSVISVIQIRIRQRRTKWQQGKQKCRLRGGRLHSFQSMMAMLSSAQIAGAFILGQHSTLTRSADSLKLANTMFA